MWSILRKYNEGLYQHLSDLEIIPEFFYVKWLRLLFIREIDYSHVFRVFDALFADNYLRHRTSLQEP
ncbi:hypothetical protein KIPB_017238, partial [Kipferlia bialata]|eukprot:g17238.t1